ncbi:hypothetical protein CYMTET_20227 [Cymbomonas tetramitiformis]|uniref:Uncharacterized protein n=1 Tax=Cymbomonas tetramitiformis TaxID=36881 RepID=A0AAE0G4I0_9CHLO|nr:hypothetical protein CYMTET_20227 [Cymbomonas tetramitiformis]
MRNMKTNVALQRFVQVLFLGIQFLRVVHTHSQDAKIKRFAYVTVLTQQKSTDYEYVVAARVLFSSLRKTGTPHELLALVSPGFPSEWRVCVG